MDVVSCRSCSIRSCILLFEKSVSDSFTYKAKSYFSNLYVLIVLGGLGGYIALTTEAPLPFLMENEPESWKTSWYPITDVKPDTEYTLKVTVSTKPGRKKTSGVQRCW